MTTTTTTVRPVVAQSKGKPNGASAHTMNLEQELAALRAENERLRAMAAETQKGITFEYRPIGERKTASDGEVYEGKGNVLVRGLNRQPYSFYPEQFLAFLQAVQTAEWVPGLLKNRAVLAWKRGLPSEAELKAKLAELGFQA